MDVVNNCVINLHLDLFLLIVFSLDTSTLIYHLVSKTLIGSRIHQLLYNNDLKDTYGSLIRKSVYQKVCVKVLGYRSDQSKVKHLLKSEQTPFVIVECEISQITIICTYCHGDYFHKTYSEDNRGILIYRDSLPSNLHFLVQIFNITDQETFAELFGRLPSRISVDQYNISKKYHINKYDICDEVILASNCDPIYKRWYINNHECRIVSWELSNGLLDLSQTSYKVYPYQRIVNLLLYTARHHSTQVEYVLSLVLNRVHASCKVEYLPSITTLLSENGIDVRSMKVVTHISGTSLVTKLNLLECLSLHDGISLPNVLLDLDALDQRSLEDASRSIIILYIRLLFFGTPTCENVIGLILSKHGFEVIEENWSLNVYLTKNLLESLDQKRVTVRTMLFTEISSPLYPSLVRLANSLLQVLDK